MKIKKFQISMLIIAAFVILPICAWADLTTIEIEGIDGPDQTPRGHTCITLYGLGLNVSGTIGAIGGGGSGAVRADFQPIQVLKRLDVTSPQLFIWVANGSHIPEATIKIWKKVDDEYIPYYKIKLQNVIISSLSTTGGQDQDALLELISLSFSKIELTATPINADGSQGADVTKTWDLETNQES